MDLCELTYNSIFRLRELSEEMEKSEKHFAERLEEQQKSAQSASDLARNEYNHSLNQIQVMCKRTVKQFRVVQALLTKMKHS